MDVALHPSSDLLSAVRRLTRGPALMLTVIGGLLGLAALYIGYFGTTWGLLLLAPALALILAAVALERRLRRGRASLRQGRPYLQLDEDGARTADGEHLAWSDIDQVELVRAVETPLDALPDGSRATVMNAGGTRGTWRIALREGDERAGRFDFVPTRDYHALLITGRDLARAGGSLLLDQQEAP
ncbi:hypothetical protein [Brachybacterium sp. FME24]|uniref:hypothetical protein n=1 Tax=Brachybacterium sp. FME24 TaxID=2742605 RepID=UPI0018672D34|nr:hypothetical protein [Brachybacterium sp. FME24]